MRLWNDFGVDLVSKLLPRSQCFSSTWQHCADEGQICLCRGEVLWCMTQMNLLEQGSHTVMKACENNYIIIILLQAFYSLGLSLITCCVRGQRWNEGAGFQRVSSHWSFYLNHFLYFSVEFLTPRCIGSLRGGNRQRREQLTMGLWNLIGQEWPCFLHRGLKPLSFCWAKLAWNKIIFVEFRLSVLSLPLTKQKLRRPLVEANWFQTARACATATRFHQDL